MAEFMIKKIFRMSVANEERAAAGLERYRKETGAKPGITAREAVEFAKSDRYKVKIFRSLSLSMMLNQAPVVAEHFRIMDWGFYHAPKDCSFVTSARTRAASK